MEYIQVKLCKWVDLQKLSSNEDHILCLSIDKGVILYRNIKVYSDMLYRLHENVMAAFYKLYIRTVMYFTKHDTEKYISFQETPLSSSPWL